jgi:hypothetical protein
MDMLYYKAQIYIYKFILFQLAGDRSEIWQIGIVDPFLWILDCLSF